MSLFRRAREVTGDLAAASKRHAQRGKLEVEVRRLESKVSAEKNAIGHALFPLLEAGTLSVKVAEVHQHMAAIGELLGKIAQKRVEVEALHSGSAVGDPCARTAALVGAGCAGCRFSGLGHW